MGSNIAIFCLTNLGDGVLLSPCISALAEHAQDAKLTLVAKPSICDLYAHDSRISSYVPYTCSWFPGPEGRHDGLKGFWRTVKTLRSLDCTDGLNTASDLRTNLLARFSGIKCLIATHGRHGNFLATKLVASELNVQHEAERQLELADVFLGKEVGPYSLQIPLAESDIRAAIELIEMSDEDGPLVAIHPGANVAFKAWPAEYFVSLGKFFVNELKCRVAVLGAPGKESVLAGYVADSIGSKARSIGGKTSVRELIAFLERCALYVGNDSGPMHLAAAAGCPTVALFGATNHSRFGPFLPKKLHRIVVSPLYQPAAVTKAKEIGSQLMASISVDMVILAIYDIWPQVICRLQSSNPARFQRLL